jgi:hypothetical protein
MCDFKMFCPSSPTRLVSSPARFAVTRKDMDRSVEHGLSAAYHEDDNGLNAVLQPGESGTFYNSVDNTGNASQSQTEIGTPNNFAFTFQLNRNESQKTPLLSPLNPLLSLLNRMGRKEVSRVKVNGNYFLPSPTNKR